ncbi:MAG: hypothetical protein Q9173_005575, partial [Seirophora scorigena]
MPPKRSPKQQQQPWLKRVLIPFWVFQMLCMLGLIGVQVWVILGTLTVPAINVSVIIAEIILFARRRLHPLAYLLFQVLKTSLWTVLFIMSTIGLEVLPQRNDHSVSLITYLFTGIIEVLLVL